jgi:glycosyltransferase involved in cell wall biosynthesis
MGGQERVALDLAVGQIAAGSRALVISLAPPPDGPLRADFDAHGVETHTVAKRDGFDATLPFRLAALLRRRGVQIVHTHNPQPLIYGAPAARLAGARAVHTKHGSNVEVGRIWLRRAAALLVDAYVAVSAETMEQARRDGDAPARKLRAIANGIDLSRFFPDEDARAAVRAELGIPAAAMVVISVGRLVPDKHQALLVRAMAPLVADGTRLVLVGDGPEAPALRAQVQALAGARFVHLVGARRDVPRLLAAADLFALSSRTEGLPLAIPEAMAAGLPVVSTAVGGIPSVIDEGETGFLVPPDDESALRARVAALAGDAARTRRMGQHARAVALERYAAARMVRDYLALYQRVLKES